MSQDKAASLTSSLFARKGRASPASLVIAGLPEPVAPEAEGEAPVDLHEAHDGAPMKRSALELKGQPRRRGGRDSEGELPLLAFVEAQLAAEARCQDAAAGEPEEASPAASLLERAGAGLRRANGRALDVSPVETVRAVEVGDDAAAAPQSRASDDEEAPVEETISGDANVTAIEDAPACMAEAAPEVTTETAAPENETPVSEGPVSGAGESENAPVEPVVAGGEPEVADAAAAEQQVPAPSAELKAASDAAITAALALRQAAAQRAAASPGAERPAASHPAPANAASPARSSPAVWRSAAVVALGVALGLGAYAFFSSGETPDTTQQAAAPVIEPLVETPAEAAAPEAQVAAPLEAADASESPAPARQEAAAALPEPSFDIIRIAPDGQSIIAGRALPFSEWILLNNGEPIASVTADINGEWVVLPDASLVPGANAFSLVPKAERGKVAIPAPEAAEPASAPAEPAASNGPRAEALPPELPQTQAVALPRAKPQPATPPVFRVAAGGGYEVQLASVRESADAEREMRRLALAYPGLLGELELRVQEASVAGAGTFYRVRSGALAHLGEAREVCRRLEGQGQGCLVVKRLTVAAPAEPVAGEEAGDAGLEPHAPPRQQAERP